MSVLIVSRMHFVGELLTQALRTKGKLIAIHGPTPAIIDVAIQDQMPDVVVVDSSQPGGLAIVSGIRARVPSVRLVVLALSDHEEEFLAWANVGISGYVAPETPLDELISVIRRSAAGEVTCPPRLTALLLSRFATQVGVTQSRGGVHHLTLREREILEFLADGLSNKLIACRLRITAATVKNHVHSILRKWDLRSRGEAAARYREFGQDQIGRFLSSPSRLSVIDGERALFRVDQR
jgi:two-component system nitrate/nitrite response regulator NarL